MEVSEVTAPGIHGEFGVLAEHTGFVTVLRPGAVVYRKGAQTGAIAVGRGYAEVSAGKTILLVDSGELAGEIDLEAAKASLAKCEEAMKTLSPEDEQYQSTVDALELAQARIKARERGKGGTGH